MKKLWINKKFLSISLLWEHKTHSMSLFINETLNLQLKHEPSFNTQNTIQDLSIMSSIVAQNINLS